MDEEKNIQEIILTDAMNKELSEGREEGEE